MGIFKRKMNGDDLYRIDQSVKAFCKTHKGELTKREHRKLRKLLNKRAAALSDCLGVTVHSICEK